MIATELWVICWICIHADGQPLRETKGWEIYKSSVTAQKFVDTFECKNTSFFFPMPILNIYKVIYEQNLYGEFTSNENWGKQSIPQKEAK